MYQVKATDGNEIEVNGDACRVIGRNGEATFVGTFAGCLAFMQARGIRTLGDRSLAVDLDDNDQEPDAVRDREAERRYLARREAARRG